MLQFEKDSSETHTGALTTALISGADGLVSLTAYGGGDPFTAYQLFNPHGDSEAITDTGGNVLYSSTWDAFGNAITGGGLSYGYSAKYLRESDYLTGYTRMGVREYDPTAGRFTSVDPLKGDPYNPQSRNRYGYALNDPLTVYDLSGLSAGTDWIQDTIDRISSSNAPVRESATPYNCVWQAMTDNGDLPEYLIPNSGALEFAGYSYTATDEYTMGLGGQQYRVYKCSNPSGDEFETNASSYNLYIYADDIRTNKLNAALFALGGIWGVAISPPSSISLPIPTRPADYDLPAYQRQLNAEFEEMQYWQEICGKKY